MNKGKNEIEIRNIKLELEEPETLLLSKAEKKAGVSGGSFRDLRILRRSIDARNKNRIQLVYNVAVKADAGLKLKLQGDVIRLDQLQREELLSGIEQGRGSFVVIGSGPAGMFAALELARKGYQPVLYERGKAVEERDMDISRFFKGGELNSESNVQFGEGGAGTYSDGKLTTRIKDPRCDEVFETFVEMGAPEEILYAHKPHIGTDILKNVVRNLRREIIRLGGQVHFSSKLTNIRTEAGRLKEIQINGDQWVPTAAVILAIGHSSRDTYEQMFRSSVAMEPKPFAIGLRIEHEQKMLNELQYGKYATHPRLGAADYSLAMRSEKTGRSAYSFCMCPGGYVVGATSEEGQVVVNGMSEYPRDGENANSALVVNVRPADFGEGVLSGVEFQRRWEKAAFVAGGEDYSAPFQRVGEFLGNREVGKKGSDSVKPTYLPGVKQADLSLCLPDYVINTLKDGLTVFDKKIRGFADGGAILTGVETRTSAPVRILRGEDLQSINIRDLYPCGEGAGYAGGIVSAAVDGLRCAEAIIHRFARG